MEFAQTRAPNTGADDAPVVADVEVLVQELRLARHGGLVKNTHEIEGLNSRLDGLQAAVLSVKLPHLAKWTKARQDVAASILAPLDRVGSAPLDGSVEDAQAA